jgi:AraC-like DNA-binding protein
MTASGTAVFTNPDDYRAGMVDANVDLVLTKPGDFNARLTWLTLDHFHAFRGSEGVPRIAYMSLAPTRVFVSFPLTSSFVLVWNGVELQLGDIVLHSRGERGHQWTKGTSQWGLVSFPASKFADYCRALAEFDLPDRPVGQILRLPPSVAVRLRRLHSRACHLAETKPAIIVYQEAAHAIEQEFIYTLVNCLAAGDTHSPPAIQRRHAEIMIRFEEILRTDFGELPSAPKLCAAMGIAERTLRACCVKSVGLSPGQYIRLRQLNLARSELQRASATTTVAQIALRCRFSELGRFAVYYRMLFGESPSETLRRARAESESCAIPCI